MRIDRFIHFIVGVIFFYIFFKLSKHEIDTKDLIITFISMALGTWLSDWDLLLGIEFHRSPLTHSIIPAMLVGYFVLKRNLPICIIIGFSLGLASHLFWDIIAYGNVQWITGGNNDRLFLLINAIVLLIAIVILQKKYLSNKKAKVI